MIATSFTVRTTAVTVIFGLLAGCKLMEDKVDAGFTGETGSATGAAPLIWGEPDTSALIGANYSFTPEASDSDGDVLEFSVANKPGWTSFDTATGLLQGVPGNDDAGQHGNIIVSVSDGTSVVSLASFAITVESTAGPDPDSGNGGSDGGTANPSAAPTISGTPNTTAIVDTFYAFRPEASDPEGDELSFSIVNKPGWAKFNTVNGRLRGTPTSADVGTGNPIEISVTDGTSVAALKRFRITVEQVGTVSHSISWTPPTENEDGTPLTDLAGYRIYYGTASGDYGETIEIGSGVTSYLIEDLAPGTYYLAMTSFNSLGMESRRTREISFNPGT